MNESQYTSNLAPPQAGVDAVLDTDAFNEIDDQFAISYMLRSDINLKQIYAAPFFNTRSSSPADGMEKSYNEIFHVLRLAGREDLSTDVFRGSDRYLPDDTTPVDSPAARALIGIASRYSPENPLYVVAIGAITNVASALLLAPEIAENIVIVWLGGHAHHTGRAAEFNMMQDYSASRVVFSCASPIVQLPCDGVVSAFYTTEPELKHWLVGKNELSTYLAENTIRAAHEYAGDIPWSRVIWDVTAVAWLNNGDGRFLAWDNRPAPTPRNDGSYGHDDGAKTMAYVTTVYRDALMTDLFGKLRG